MSSRYSLGPAYETYCNVFCNSSKQIDVYKSSKKNELYIIQVVMCHTGDIPCNKSDRWLLKNFQGRPYETSCNIFCNSSKQIDVYKSPKNIDFYTIQAVMCHTGDIPCNKSYRWGAENMPQEIVFVCPFLPLVVSRVTTSMTNNWHVRSTCAQGCLIVTI